MQSPAITQGRLMSVDAGWMSGMNSVRYPWFLRQDQYRRGVNVVNRGGVIQTRPGFRMRLTLPEGNLQGMVHFQVTKNGRRDDYLVFAVDGKIYFSPFPLVQPRLWEQFRLKNLQFDSSVDMIYFAVAEKTVTTAPDQTLQIVPSHNVLMIQDGVGPAAYWDGEEDRHLVEAAPSLETPTGTWMTFSGGRLWVARENVLLASDLFDPIKFSERVEGEGRGDFAFPKNITGMANFIGNDRLEVVVVFTDERSEIVLSGIRDRTQWATTQGMQSVLFPSTGCVAGRSIVFQAGLMWWYSSGGLVASDSAASTNLTSQINYRDAEMAFSKQFLSDDQSMICGLSFENYLLLSMPIGQNLNSETFVLDYSPMSEFASEKIPAWSGVWTGIRPVQWASPVIGGKRRAFAASVDYKALSDGSHNHIWEAFMPEREDTYFELGSDFTTTDFSRPIFCEFETRLMGDGHDLKSFQYADISLIEVAGDAYVVADYRGTRGAYKPVLCKRIIAPITAISSGANVPDDQLGIFDGLKKQSRRVMTENALPSDGCPTCESEYSENIDKAFSVLVRWCGQMAVESIRVFMEPWAERAEGRCEEDETQVCLVGEDGKNYIFDRDAGFVPIEDLFESAGNAWASTRSASVTLNCPVGSVTAGPLTATATATYRSRISQADADTQAQTSAQTAAQAQADYLRTVYPCYYDSVQLVTRHCYSELNDDALAMTRLPDGRVILGGQFWQDNTTNQGKVTAKTSAGVRSLTFTQGDGFVSNFGAEPSSEQINVLLNDTNGIYALGEFSEYNNVARTRIARLTTAGAIDATVTFGTGFDAAPVAACLLPQSTLAVATAQVVAVSGSGGKYFDIGDAAGVVRIWMDSNNLSTPPATPSGGRLLEVDMSAGLSEITRVTTLADVAGSLDETYFVLHDAAATTVAVWFAHSGGSTAPTGYTRNLKVDINNNDSANTIASLLQAAVDADAQFSATVASNVVTITNAYVGAVTDVVDGTDPTGFAFLVTRQGVDIDTASQLATKIQLAVDADAQFSATVLTDTVTITASAAGCRQQISEPDSGTYFDVLQITAGVTAGSLAVGGTFTSYNSIAVAQPFIRMCPLGNFDPFFLPTGFTKIFALLSTATNLIHAVGYDSGPGKIRVARLATTGIEDPAFTPYEVTASDPGFASMAIQTDGKLIVSFDGANSGKNIVRLNTDGSVDATYDVGTGLNAAARAILILADGTVILGGNFTTYNSAAVPRIVKTAALGAAVGAFNPGTGFNSTVRALMLPSAGTFFYAAGDFTSYNGNTDSYERFGRVNQTTGASLDTRETVNVTGRHRGTVSQVDSDTQALALANATALIALPCN